MRLVHVVSVDYAELASYLQQHHDPERQDDPLPHATFHYNRERLAQHVEQLMDEEGQDDNPELTQILLKYHTFGSVTDVMVSYAPGRVVHTSEGHSVILPMILIKIDY